ncbi:MAG: Bacteriophage lambda head decoration protein [Sporomusa sp.]|jgi:hypothetical protein|nr:Bacteriophage lambda head decoration protein [Sporomusa sp.]
MANTPGQSDVATYQPIEIRAITGYELSLAATLAPTTAELAAGTVLGQITASKLYVPYKKTATDGSEVAKLILAETVLASTAPQNVTTYAKGVFYTNKLIGLDADGITALNARVIDTLVII